MHTDPISQFNTWLELAKATPAIPDATAMTLATATKDGAPSARIVLLKDADAQGFVFYTNHASRKSHEISENPRAALCFYWAPLNKQVRVEGSVQAVTNAEADAYFASRDRERQIGAWASLQSEILDHRSTLKARVAEYTDMFAGGAVPRPPHWSGWRVVPHSIEFWQQGEHRLHTRDVFTRRQDNGWEHQLLYP